MDKIIEVKNLKKSYGSVQAVKGIDFYVERGKLFAFLGPNGAGKSTTINTICTFLKPDSGEVIVNGNKLGRDDEKIRASIGAVFQESLLDSRLTVEENLRLRGSLYGLKGEALTKRIQDVAEKTEIQMILKRQYGKLSGGQRRRCDIARALVHTPDILFLDEPTTGLDPQTRRSVWDTIKQLQKENNMTVFLTTHYMEEAQEADYVIVVDDGKIAAKGTPAELQTKFTSDLLCIYFDTSIKNNSSGKVEEILKQQGIQYKKTAGRIEIALANTKDALPIVQSCENYIKGFTVSMGSMDDVFINITGKEIRE